MDTVALTGGVVVVAVVVGGVTGAEVVVVGGVTGAEAAVVGGDAIVVEGAAVGALVVVGGIALAVSSGSLRVVAVPGANVSDGIPLLTGGAIVEVGGRDVVVGPAELVAIEGRAATSSALSGRGTSSDTCSPARLTAPHAPTAADTVTSAQAEMSSTRRTMPALWPGRSQPLTKRELGNS